MPTLQTRGAFVRLAVPVAIGLAFGVVVRLGDAGTGVVPWLVNIGGPWVLLAFAVGWWSRRCPAAAGVACLIAAVVAKYGVQVGQGEITAVALVTRLAVWGTAAVAIGTVFGASGALARRRTWWPWALAGAVLGVEAVVLLGGVVHGESAHLRYDGQTPATVVLVAELGTGVGAFAIAAFVAARSRRPDSPQGDP